MTYAAPAIPAVGDLITAAQGAILAQNQIDAADAWTAYTPTWTSSGTAPALGNGTLTGRYQQNGKSAQYEIRLTAGSTTTFGTGNYNFSLPTAAHDANPDAMGWAYVNIAGTRTAGVAIKASTALVNILVGSALLTNAVPGTMVATNTVSVSGSYEGA